MSIFVSLLSPVGKVAFYLENLNPLHPTMLCANFGWNWPIGCCFVNVFSLFPNYLLLEKGVTLYLNKFESLSSKDDLFQVWLNLALWFWKRRWKCEKFTDRRAMDDTRSEKLTWAFSTEDLKYQICLILWRIRQIIVVLVVYSFQK